MMMRGRLRSEAAVRFEERRQREHEAPRLRDVVPTLATLRLEITEARGSMGAEPKYVRIVVVDSAPALFVLTCGDHACRDGGHDLTTAIMRGLTAKQTRFEVEDLCYGNLGHAECGRTMRVQIIGSYR